jgi:ribose transport system permease protein
MSIVKISDHNLEADNKWRRNAQSSLKLIKKFQSVFGLIAIVVLASILTVRDGEYLFLNPTNLANVVRSISENGIIAIGMTLVILVAGIDLSVGAILGLTATAAADL